MVKQLLHLFSFRKNPKPQIVITIPEPCDEKWSQMKKVDDCHRHCAACDRVLTDFAGMNDDELMLFFKQAHGKICGRFRVDQLNRPLRPLPEKTSKAIWWKAAMLLPFTLFSKSGSSQQINPDSVKTEQAPFMVQTNDSLVMDWGHGVTLDTTIKWNWHDNEEGWYPWGPIITGGVPMILYEWNLTVPTISCEITVPDTIPHAEVNAGIQAAASPAPKNIPGVATASRFGKNLAAIPKQEE